MIALIPWVIFLFIFLKRQFGLKKSQIEIKNDQKIFHDGLSVLVPFHGEWELIRPCLESLLKQSYQGEINIFVITNRDNNEKLKNLLPKIHDSNRSIQLLISDEDQKSKKLNMGLDFVRNRYVAFLDADHFADNDWISSGLSYLKKINIGAESKAREHQLIKMASFMLGIHL